MIEAGKYDYKTTDGRSVVLLSQTRDIKGVKIFVGVIGGERGYRHWTEDGKLFGEVNKRADLA